MVTIGIEDRAAGPITAIVATRANMKVLDIISTIVVTLNSCPIADPSIQYCLCPQILHLLGAIDAATGIYVHIVGPIPASSIRCVGMQVNIDGQSRHCGYQDGDEQDN
jgi:ammonia channel protein AmtB